jgi:hypothetical protein
VLRDLGRIRVHRQILYASRSCTKNEELKDLNLAKNSHLEFFVDIEGPQITVQTLQICQIFLLSKVNKQALSVHIREDIQDDEQPDGLKAHSRLQPVSSIATETMPPTMGRSSMPLVSCPQRGYLQDSRSKSNRSWVSGKTG